MTIVGYYTDTAVDTSRLRTRRSFFYEFWRWLTSWWREVDEVDEQGVGAGGVTEMAWNSARKEKRVAELLVLRTCFRHYYERTLRELGHKPEGAYRL